MLAKLPTPRWIATHLQAAQPLMLTEHGGRCHTGVFRGVRGGAVVMGNIGGRGIKWTVALSDIAEIQCSTT